MPPLHLLTLFIALKVTFNSSSLGGQLYSPSLPIPRVQWTAAADASGHRLNFYAQDVSTGQLVTPRMGDALQRHNNVGRETNRGIYFV